MTIEEWHAKYSDLIRDRDTQARHVASLLDEWTAEKEKLDRLELAIRAWMDKAPSEVRQGAVE